MDCAICNELFDLADHLPVVGSCGHSVCSQCAVHSGGSCPLCRQSAAFSLLKRNFQMIAMVEHFQSVQKQEKNQGSVPSSELSSLSFGRCQLCSSVVEENKLRVCLTCISDPERFTKKRPVGSYLIQKNEFVLCGSCFLEGPHEGHDNEIWLPRKLRSEADRFLRSIEDGKNFRKLFAKENFEKLINSMDSLDQIFERLCERATQFDSVAHCKEFIKKCREELEVIGSVEGNLAEQLEEHTDKINALKKALERLIQPESSNEYPRLNHAAFHW